MSDKIDDTPITPDELIKEIQEASRNATPVHRNTIEEGFATLSYDDYYILRDKLVEYISIAAKYFTAWRLSVF